MAAEMGEGYFPEADAWADAILPLATGFNAAAQRRGEAPLSPADAEYRKFAALDFSRTL